MPRGLEISTLRDFPMPGKRLKLVLGCAWWQAPSWIWFPASRGTPMTVGGSERSSPYDLLCASCTRSPLSSFGCISPLSKILAKSWSKRTVFPTADWSYHQWGPQAAHLTSVWYSVLISSSSSCLLGSFTQPSYPASVYQMYFHHPCYFHMWLGNRCVLLSIS